MLTVVSNNDLFVGTGEGYKVFNTGPHSEFNNLVTLRKDLRGMGDDIDGQHQAPLANKDEYSNNENTLASTIAYATAKENNEDYYCFWKLRDALIDCSFYNEDCSVAFGNTFEQRYMGIFNNGIEVRELNILTHDVVTNNPLLANEESFNQIFIGFVMKVKIAMRMGVLGIFFVETVVTPTVKRKI